MEVGECFLSSLMPLLLLSSLLLLPSFVAVFVVIAIVFVILVDCSSGALPERWIWQLRLQFAVVVAVPIRQFA